MGGRTPHRARARDALDHGPRHLERRRRGLRGAGHRRLLRRALGARPRCAAADPGQCGRTCARPHPGSGDRVDRLLLTRVQRREHRRPHPDRGRAHVGVAVQRQGRRRIGAGRAPGRLVPAPRRRDRRARAGEARLPADRAVQPGGRRARRRVPARRGPRAVHALSRRGHGGARRCRPPARCAVLVGLHHERMSRRWPRGRARHAHVRELGVDRVERSGRRGRGGATRRLRRWTGRTARARRGAADRRGRRRVDPPVRRRWVRRLRGGRDGDDHG